MRNKYVDMKYIKNILPLIIIFFVTGASFSQEYFHTSLSKAKKIAKEENKRLFVDFSAVWCGPCKMMEEKVFPDPEIESFLTKNFICVKLMHGKNKSLFSRYKIKSYPTFVILKSNGEEFYRIKGASSKKSFLERLKLIPDESLLVEKYDSLYNHNKKDVTFLREYFDVLLENEYYEKAKKISKKILKYEDNWMKKKNMILVLSNLDNQKYYKFLLKNKQVFCDSFSVKSIDRILFNKYFAEHIRSDTRNNYVNIKKIKKAFRKLFNEENSTHYINNYFFYILRYKSDPKIKKAYIYSALKYLQYEKNLFNTGEFYSQIQILIFRMTDDVEYKEMQKVFNYQFEEDLQKIYLPYFDLKALVEYQLGYKDKAVLTIQKANELSVKKTGKPFKAKLKSLLQLDKAFNK